MLLIPKKTVPVLAPPARLKRASNDAPAYLQALVRAVEESWEAPDAAQYENCFDHYVEALLEPLTEEHLSIEETLALFRSKVERMIEIAPDLFEKALRRSPLETGYFIDGGDDDTH